MARPNSVVARERADIYATRTVLIEWLRMIQLNNPGTVPALRAAIAHACPLRPDDILCLDADIREAAEMILAAAQQ